MSNESPRPHRLAACVSGLVLLASCSLFKSFDGFEGAGPAPDSGAPGLDGANDPDASGCPRTSWPGVPPAGAEGPDVEGIVVALDELQVLSNPGAVRGFNVDERCTCPEGPACRGVQASCDADGGVDNAAAALFDQFVGAGVAIDDEGLRTGNRKGRYSVLLRVLGYNGRADDPDVVVALLNGFELAGGGDAGAPLFDGNDEWRIDREGYPDGRIALFTSSRAWVAGGTLVAEIPSIVVKLRVPDETGYQLIRLAFVDVHLSAKLVQRGGSYALAEGTLAGRWPAAAALEQLQLNKICADNPIYPTVKERICQSRDVPLSATEDGRDVACRALSFGFGFSATRAKLGPVGMPEDPAGCALVADDCEP